MHSSLPVLTALVIAVGLVAIDLPPPQPMPTTLR